MPAMIVQSSREPDSKSTVSGDAPTFLSTGIHATSVLMELDFRICKGVEKKKKNPTEQKLSKNEVSSMRDKDQEEKTPPKEKDTQNEGIKSHETSGDLSRYCKDLSREKSQEPNQSGKEFPEFKFYKQSGEKSPEFNRQFREKFLEFNQNRFRWNQSQRSMRDSLVQNRSLNFFQSQWKESEDVTQSRSQKLGLFAHTVLVKRFHSHHLEQSSNEEKQNEEQI